MGWPSHFWFGCRFVVYLFLLFVGRRQCEDRGPALLEILNDKTSKMKIQVITTLDKIKWFWYLKNKDMKGQRGYIQGETLKEVEVVDYGKGHQVRWNLTKETTDDPTGQRTTVNFDYVNVDELTKKAVKAGIIKSKYLDYDDELAAINNGGTDYEAYQSIRAEADLVWNEIQGIK